MTTDRTADTEKRTKVFSGIQPSGVVHVGNYVGAIRNWASMMQDYDCTFCVVDLHAMTIPYEPEDMRTRVIDTFVLNMAAGLDPERTAVFVQSDVKEHAELHLLFSMIIPIGVPVVRPSKTPDMMRIASVSFRWLVCRLRPVRLRSTSAWISSSVSASPGGQPSTIQPRPGPWLSPKVVTVKSLPCVLPAILLFLLGYGEFGAECIEFAGTHQKHALAAMFELHPGERHPRISGLERWLTGTDFHDQQTVIGQMFARIVENSPRQLQAVRSGLDTAADLPGARDGGVGVPSGM